MAKQVAQVAAQQGAAQTQQRNLYITVNTYDSANKQIGTRVVDMFHYGTRPWLQKHEWWALQNGHTVELTAASPEEVSDYVAKNALALAAQYAKVA